MLTERLLLPNPESKIVCRSGTVAAFASADVAVEKNPILYLLACHSRSDYQVMISCFIW